MGDYSCALRRVAFMWVLRVQTQVLTLCGKCFSHQTISPAPCFFFYFGFNVIFLCYSRHMLMLRLGLPLPCNLVSKIISHILIWHIFHSKFRRIVQRALNCFRKSIYFSLCLSVYMSLCLCVCLSVYLSLSLFQSSLPYFYDKASQYPRLSSDLLCSWGWPPPSGLLVFTSWALVLQPVPHLTSLTLRFLDTATCGSTCLYFKQLGSRRKMAVSSGSSLAT